MPDLKISQFVDGGAVQNTDEIAAVRGGINTKVTVGSAAAADIGTGPDDVPTNSDLGTASSYSVGDQIGQIPILEDVGGSAGLPAVDGSQLTGVIPETINGLVTAGGNVTITGAGTALDPYEINSTSSVATSADDVTYNNSATGIPATNAQEAIDQTYDLADTALQPLFMVLEQQGTTPQPATASTYVKRITNTQIYNNIPGASVNLTTGDISLPAGTYKLSGWGQALRATSTPHFHQEKIRNTTDSTDICIGAIGRGLGNTTQSDFGSIFTISSTKSFAQFGIHSDGSATLGCFQSGFIGIFSHLVIEKVA